MLNKVSLIGNVGSDPDIRTMPNGGRVCNFSLATSEYWTDKNGQRQSTTEWHRIVIYNENLVKLAEKAIHKGSKLYIEGKLKSRTYINQSGVEKNITEIVLQGFNHTIVLLDPRPRNNGDTKDYVNDDNAVSSQDDTNSIPDDTMSMQAQDSGIDNNDDDIPF